MRKQKIFLNGKRPLTEKEARELFPNPRFFYRAHDRMSREEVVAIVLRNIAEIRFWLEQWEKIANGNCNGRVRKFDLILDANRMHDWRVGMNIKGGELGRPYLWEA